MDTANTGAIEFHGLTKNYGKQRGVTELNFSVQPGEIFGFIGPNGAGKSTTIRLLLNLIYPTGGSATILGHDVVADSAAIKRFTSYVPSEVFYYEQLTVRELLAYAGSFIEEFDGEYVDELCTRFQLDKTRKIEDLSLGNRKKVSLVVALMKRPKVIILDEPAAGLDPLMQNVLFEVLREHQASGTTIFLSSHNLPEVERYCDRVAVIRDGAVVEVATVADVVKEARKVVSIETAAGDKKVFLVKGNLNKLVARLAEYDLVDLEVRAETLEESFMKYYENGEATR